MISKIKNDIKENCTNGLCQNTHFDSCLSCISNQNEFGWETIELDKIEELRNKYLVISGNMISNTNNITNSNVKMNSEELNIIGKAVETSFNKKVESLMPFYEGINVEEHFVLHPYSLVEDLCLIRGYKLDLSTKTNGQRLFTKRIV